LTGESAQEVSAHRDPGHYAEGHNEEYPEQLYSEKHSRLHKSDVTLGSPNFKARVNMKESSMMMKHARPWLYFITFILILAALSTFKNTAPDLYDEFALAADAVWLAGVVVMSFLVIHRTWKRSSNAMDGFGLAGLPFPKKWKRWMYDEAVRELKEDK